MINNRIFHSAPHSCWIQLISEFVNVNSQQIWAEISALPYPIGYGKGRWKVALFYLQHPLPVPTHFHYDCLQDAPNELSEVQVVIISTGLARPKFWEEPIILTWKD